ncbi:MAG: hypothetical protein LBD24_09160, partial [Spirochaetaceae bacterium]|nr:hypothetical protein [Spirochaetaceae bacterium]
LALLTGSRAEMENSPSGALVEARFLFHRSRDPKTGAVLARSSRPPSPTVSKASCRAPLSGQCQL